jgi:small subunit ribosomal protein S17
MEVNNEIAKRLYTGEVVSDKMEKTVVVAVVRTFKDKRFHKVLHATKKYKVHDENGQAKMGDTVEFYEGRHLSKTKYMYLARIVKSSAA